MKTLLITIALAASAAEPTLKARLLAIENARLKMRVAELANIAAQRTLEDTKRDYYMAQAEEMTAKLAACKDAGGAKIEDCEYGADSIKQKTSK